MNNNYLVLPLALFLRALLGLFIISCNQSEEKVPQNIVDTTFSVVKSQKHSDILTVKYSIGCSIRASENIFVTVMQNDSNIFHTHGDNAFFQPECPLIGVFKTLVNDTAIVTVYKTEAEEHIGDSTSVFLNPTSTTIEFINLPPPKCDSHN